MCSLTETIHLGNEGGTLAQKSHDFSQETCAKCRERIPSVFVRNSYFCMTCMKDSMYLRLRTSIGKTTCVAEGSHVLFAFSGGASSSVMLHMLAQYVKVDSRKRTKVAKISVVHVDDGEANPQEVKEIVIGKYNFELEIIGIEDMFDGADKTEKKANLKMLLESISSLTAREDLMINLKYSLLLSVCTHMQCQVLMLADNSTRIAINVISNTSKGKGVNLPMDIGGEVNHQRDFKAIVLRPFKEVLGEEIELYLKDEKLNCQVHEGSIPYNASISRLTESFILSLQNQFPSTVSIITRTAMKVKTGLDQSRNSCRLCQGLIGESALDWKSANTIDGFSNVKPLDFQHYCYACTTIVEECNNAIMFDKIKVRNVEKLRAEFEDFLLSEE